MTWRVLVWCDDCRYNDPLGCFDGGSDFLDGSYETEADARLAGEAWGDSNDGAPYAWQAVETSPEIER